MKRIKRFEDIFESFDGEAMYHSGAVTKRFARMMDYNNQNPAIELEEEIERDDNEILKDIYSRTNKEEFEEWAKVNASEPISEMNDDDMLWEFSYFLKDEKSIEVDNGIIEFYRLWEDVEKLIGNNPVKLYHFTSSNYLDSIKKNGLESGHNKTNPHGNSYSGVYLTTETSGKAIDGYKYHIKQTGGDIMMIGVKAYMKELQPDPDDSGLQSGETQFVIDHVSPDRIIEIEKAY